MTFEEYQKKAKKTAIYPVVGGYKWVYPALGLANEAGEVSGKLKKVLRDNSGQLTDEAKLEIKKELGDVLWYVAQVSTELGLDLDEVASDNITKLADRKQRGVIKGKGDNR